MDSGKCIALSDTSSGAGANGIVESMFADGSNSYAIPGKLLLPIATDVLSGSLLGVWYLHC